MDKKPKLKAHQRVFSGLLISSIMLLAVFVGGALASSSTAVKAPAPQPAPEEPDMVWSNFYYVYAAGSTLKPRDSAQTWNNSGSGGCIYANNNASEVMNLHLDIPTGSRIDYLRIFYYDTSASNSIAWVTTYDGAAGITDITNVSSAGTGGYGTALSAYVGHVVDNLNYAYVLNWRPVVAGSTMMLCGLRVAYRLPMTEVFIPYVRK